MADLLKDKTNKALVSMSLPISIGMLSTFLFQIIDTYFVGQLGADALAALSFSSTVYFLLVGLFIGFSVGVSIIIGKSVGAGEMEKVRSTAVVSMILAFLLSAILSFFGILFIEPVFSMLGAGEEVMPMIKDYTIPVLMGIPLLTVGLLFGGILRASGNVTKPEVLMAGAGVVNLVFDYVLIFGRWGFPEMGIKGAAFATVASWVFIILGMFYLMFKDRLLGWGAGLRNNVLEITKDIFRLGTPTIVTQIVGPLTLMFLTYLLASQSSMAVAAFGVAGRIEILLMIGILGVSTAMTPFIAQNFGAKLKDRIDEAIAFGGKASVYLGILVAILMFIFIRPIAGIFSDNAEVISYTSNYFYLVSGSYVFYGLFLITTSIFNGLQLPVNSLKISMVKSFVFTVPMTFIGSFWGVSGIFAGLALSNVAAGVFSGIQMRHSIKNSDSSLKDVNVLNEYLNDFRWLLGMPKK